MVQFFPGVEDPRLASAGVVGEKLGNSISDVLQGYFINKSIDKFIEDPQNKNLSTSDRLNKMLSTLNKHGPRGIEEFGRRFQLEQIAENEKAQAKAEREKLKSEKLITKQQAVLAKALRGEPLSTEEESLLPANAQLAVAKLKQPKAAPGGISGQPVPREVSQAILPILNQFKDASADELAAAFDEAGVPRAYSNSYIENRRRQDETKAKVEAKSAESKRNEELVFHKESQKFDEDLLKHTKAAKNQLQAIETIDKSIKSGNVSPTSLANIFKGFGSIGAKLSEALLNKDQAALVASIPQLLEGWKEVFGIRLSDADLRLLQDKLPSLGKSNEANNIILNIMKKYADQTLLRSKIAHDIKEKNKGLRPLNYADEIEQRFDQMTKPVKIKNPNTGRTVDIPAYRVSEYVDAGGEIVNE